jgi:hypothetical protein
MKMKRKTMFCMLSLCLLSAASVNAQITVGGLTDPAAGVILDLNSPGGARGGLVLSSIAITDLSEIPANELLGISSAQDVNEDLRGTLVYNTGTPGVPAGIYAWNGYCWSPDGNCTPIITPSPSPAITVYSSGYADLAVTADGCPPLTYTWYENTVASTTGGSQVGTNVETYATPTGLPDGTHYYYCTVKSDYSNVVATSDLFTVTVSPVSPCSGATVYNGAYNGPSAGTYTPDGIEGYFSAGWSHSVFTPQYKDLCWAATDIPGPPWPDWPGAVATCAALTTDGVSPGSWRLPNLKELQFFYEAIGGTGDGVEVTDLAALDANGTGTANGASVIYGQYWSSTEISSDEVYFFSVYGSRYSISKSLYAYARCVRSL